MSALVIFTVDVRRLAAFYEAVLEVRPTLEPSGDIRLRAEREEILIHTIPAKIAKGIEIRTPPQPRDGAAIKPAFDVESLEVSLDAVTANHGVVTGRSFTLDGLTRHDVLDPDGNVIQLRGHAN